VLSLATSFAGAVAAVVVVVSSAEMLEP